MELTKLEYVLKPVGIMNAIKVIKKVIIYIRLEDIIAMEEDHKLSCAIIGEVEASLITLSCGREYYIEPNYDVEQSLT